MDPVAYIAMSGVGMLALGVGLGVGRRQERKRTKDTTINTALAAVAITGERLYGSEWWDEFSPEVTLTIMTVPNAVASLAMLMTLTQAFGEDAE